MVDSFREAFRRNLVQRQLVQNQMTPPAPRPVFRPVVTDAVQTNQFAAAKAYAAQIAQRQATSQGPSTALAAPIPQTRYGDTLMSVNSRAGGLPSAAPIPVITPQQAMGMATLNQRPPVLLSPDEANERVQVTYDAYVQNPTPENAQAYDFAQADLAASYAQDPGPSLWETINAAPAAVAHGVQTAGQAAADAELAVENFSPGLSGVAHGIQTVGGAAAEGLGNIPLFTTPGGSATVGEVVGQPDKTAAALIGGPLGAAYNNVPGVKTVMDLYQRPYEEVGRRTGEDIYEVAQTGRLPGVSNPYFYLDGTIEEWSTNPANKQKIVAAHDVGLDLPTVEAPNGDGVIDVTGADAVWMAYMTEVHPGFVDNLITQMGFDPLFAASLLAPAATGVRTGAQVGVEATAGAATVGALTKAQIVQRALFQAIEKGAAGVERVGAAGNVVADAPFTLTVGGARKLSSLLGPGGQRVVDAVAGPGQTATANRTVNAAEEFADTVQGPGGAPATFAPGVTEARNQATVGGNVTATFPPGVTEARPQATVGPGGNVVPTNGATVGPITPTVTARTTGITELNAQSGPGGNVTFVQPTPGLTTVDAQVGPGGNVQFLPTGIMDANAQSTVGGEVRVPTPGITEANNRVTVGGPAYIQFPYDPTLAALPAEIPPRTFTPRLPSPEVGPIPLEAGTIQPEVVRRTTNGVPFRAIKVDGQVTHRVLTVKGKGYQVEVKGPNGKFTKVGDPHLTIEDAEAAAVEAAGGTPAIVQEPRDFATGPAVPEQQTIPEQPATMPAATPDVPENEPWSPTHIAYTRDPVLAEIPVDRRLPTDLMTAEERTAAIRSREIPSTMPVRTGNRVIDQAWRRGDQAPEAWQRFWAAYEAPLQDYLQQKARVEGAYFQPTLDANGNPMPGLPQQKQAAQVIAGLEHLVDDIVPSFQQGFNDVPEIAPVSKRKVVPTKSGKASYRDENLPYLYERYVVTEAEKDAAKIMETLRKRPDVGTAPWWAGVEAKLIELRNKLRAWYVEQGNLGIVSPGSRRFITRGDEAIPPIADDLTGTYVDDFGESTRMSPEDSAFAQYSRQRVKKIRVKKSGKWQDGKPSDIAAYNEKHPDAPYRGTGDFKSPTLEVTEVTNLELLQETIVAHPDATAAEISQIFGNRVADLTGVRPDARIPMARWVERTRSGLGALRDVGRQTAIYNLVTGPRGLVQDQSSNMLKMVMDGHLEAVPASGAEYVRRLRNIRRDTPSLIEQTFADYGLTVPPKMRIIKGKTEVTAEGRTATHRVISDVFGVEEGSRIDKGIGIGAGATNSRIMRDARNGADNVSREAVGVSYIEKVEHGVLRDFMQRARMRAESAGIMPNSVDAYLPPKRRFSVDDVRTAMKELADDAALPPDLATEFAGKMADDWRHTIGKMRNDAAAEVDRVFFSYERTNLDEFLGNFIFYHYWMSRAIPSYTRIALRNPEIAAMWFRAWDDIKNRAEKSGYPDSMKGYIRFMGSPAGWNFGMHPLGIILPLADIMPNQRDDATLYEQITQFVAVNPVISMAAAAIGLTDDVADPLMSYSTRNMVMAGVNKLRADRGDDPIRDPYEVLLRKGTELANQIGSKVPLLGKERIFVDPMVFNQSEIRYNLAEIIAQDTGVPTDQWVIDGPEYQRFVDALTDNDAGVDNADYDAARQEWADAELAGRALNSAIPGGVRTRYGPRDEILTTPYGERTDQQQTFKSVVDSGNTTLAYQEAQFHDLGTETGRQAFALWNQIAYVDDMRSSESIQIGDEVIYGWQLKKMSQDEREELADRWIAQYETAPEEMAAYKEERTAYLDTHPEMGDFKEYQRGVGNYDNEHGAGSWMKMFAKDHEQFAEAMEQEAAFQREQGKTGSVLDAELAQWSMSTAGYNAAIGERDTIYDEPRDPTAPDFGFEEQESGGSGSTSTKKSDDPMEAVKSTITNYDKKMDEALAKMQAAGYTVTREDIQNGNPYLRPLFASFGVPASMPEDYWLYLQWKSVQPAGSYLTVDDFVRYLRAEGAQQAAA